MSRLKVIRGNSERFLSFEKGMLLSEVLRLNGIELSFPCGGRGVCGKCSCMVKGYVSEPDPAEQKAGGRLACQVVLLGDASVMLPRERMIDSIEADKGNMILPSSPMEGQYGACVDIGTTTIALNLYDLGSGICLYRCGMQNPQTSVGADIMSRIRSAMSGELALLKEQLYDAVNMLLTRSCAITGTDASAVASMVITGNTSMLYFLTGHNPGSLACSPFEADCLFDEYIELFDRKVYLPRCMHAFVGADITCAILSSGMCKQNEISLLCDVGTNGEIALWKSGELLVTSTAAGPAFEGAGINCGLGSVYGAIDKVSVYNGNITFHTIGDGPAAGLCGSGLIDAVAAALALEALDENGLLADGCFELTESVYLDQNDIRAVMMAKSALYAGINTLLDEAGIVPDDVEAFYIAGGFGSHLDIYNAASIGLFPREWTMRTKVLGNAALSGAASLLLNQNKREETVRIAGLSRHVSLGGNPVFNKYYIDHMKFT